MKSVFTIVGLFISIWVLGQTAGENYLPEAELRLYNQYEWLYALQDKDQRMQLNDSILFSFESVLISYESFEYAFDSLKRTGRIYSPDKKFRIITWNIPWQDGTHTYYGFIQYPLKKEKRCEIIPLIDQSHEIDDPENTELFAGTWFGVLYYDILLNKSSGQKYYTLLGFDFNDRFSNKKVIDVLTFEHDLPFFGKPIFETEKGGDLQHRLIFEFAPDVVMALRYDPRFKMIVLDHLSPIEPVFEGNYKFYAPDFSYDGYKFKKGIWRYQPDIDVRNR
ncbi:MAG: hypothetical protein ISS19_10220 [Bacteroidales bacterium]|nr:hypothetical protein [Bacteroidales bacterium]